MAKRLEDGFLDFYELLNQAVKIKREERQTLAESDRILANLKLYNRICKDLKLLAFNPYEYLAKALDEIGKLLGGWTKSANRKSRPGL